MRQKPPTTLETIGEVIFGAVMVLVGAGLVYTAYLAFYVTSKGVCLALRWLSLNWFGGG